MLGVDDHGRFKAVLGDDPRRHGDARHLQGAEMAGPVRATGDGPTVLQWGGEIPDGAARVEVRLASGRLRRASFEYHGTWWIWFGPAALARRATRPVAIVVLDRRGHIVAQQRPLFCDHYCG
jgi:hypothetical protein